MLLVSSRLSEALLLGGRGKREREIGISESVLSLLLLTSDKLASVGILRTPRGKASHWGR